MSIAGLSATVLAGQLAEAVAKDELPENGGCDVSAGMYGPHASQVLRDVAKNIATLIAERNAYKWGYEELKKHIAATDSDVVAIDLNGEIQARIAEATK